MTEEEKVQALLDQLHGIVEATPSERRVTLLEDLLVSVDALLEGSRSTPLLRQLEELRNALQPRVSMEEVRAFTEPLSLVHPLQAFGPTTFEVFPPHGSLLLRGVTSRNGPFEVVLDRVALGNQEILQNIDPSIYNTGWPFSPLPIGTATRLTPLVVTASSFGNPSAPPYLNLTFFGRPVDPQERDA